LRPRQRSFTHDRAVRTSSLGLRYGEITPKPNPGHVRILALGDSQTFGNGLDLGETWPMQLERMLENFHGYRWEVVNAGIPGTDTWQHEILLRRLLNIIHPHAVVLALYVNDVVPRHDVSKAEAIGQTNTSSKKLVYLLRRSAVVTWIYYRVVLPRNARRSRGNSAEDSVITGAGNDLAERGWRQVEDSFAGMKQLCDSRNVILLVAILPRRDQISGDNLGQAYNERARTIAEAHGIQALDMLPDLSAAYRLKSAALFLPWDGHNSAVANRTIAARLATTIADVPRRLSLAFSAWIESQSEIVRLSPTLAENQASRRQIPAA
jgi:lysophospholipase L1-like esterase